MLCKFQVYSFKWIVYIYRHIYSFKILSPYKSAQHIEKSLCGIQQVLIIYFLPNSVPWLWYFWRVQDNCFVECPQSGCLSVSFWLDSVGPQGSFSIFCTVAHAAFLAVMPSRSDCLLGVGCAQSTCCLLYITSHRNHRPPPEAMQREWLRSLCAGQTWAPKAWQLLPPDTTHYSAQLDQF